MAGSVVEAGISLNVEIRSKKSFWEALGNYSEKDWLADRRDKDPGFELNSRTVLLRFVDFVQLPAVSEQLGRIYETDPVFESKIKRIEAILLAVQVV